MLLSQLSKSQICVRELHLGLISKKLERHWVRNFDRESFEVKSCPVKLEVYPEILHRKKTIALR